MPLDSSGSILTLAGRQLPTNLTREHNFTIGLKSAGTLTFTGAQNITSTGSSNLTITPTGDLILDPADNYVNPNLNYDINLGAINKKYLTLHAAELWAETLVAQNTLATIGGRILVGPTTSLTRDLSGSGAGSATIFVKHNQMSGSDIAYMEAGGKVEFMRIISSASTITSGSEYSYNVTRNLDNSGANDWYAGDAVFNTGHIGSGFMDLYSISGITGSSTYGPAIVGNVRNSLTYNDWSEHWAIGQLHGLYGYGVDTWGVAFGKYATNTPHLTIDSGSGIRIYSGLSTVVGQWDTSGNILIGQTGANQNNVYISSGSMLIRNNFTDRIKLTGTGVLTINDSGGSPVLTFNASAGAEITKKLTMPGINSAIAIGVTPPTSATVGTGVWLDRDGLIGLNANEQQIRLLSNDGSIYISSSAIKLSKDGVSLLSLGKAISFYNSGSYKGSIEQKYRSGAYQIGLSAGNYTTSELLSNTGFESGTSGWNVYSPLQRDNSMPHSGLWNIHGILSWMDIPSLESDYILVSSGSNYIFTIWMKLDESGGYPYGLYTTQLEYYNSASASLGVIGTGRLTNGNPNWQFVQAYGTAPPTATQCKVRVICDLGMYGTGWNNIYIDDASLKGYRYGAEAWVQNNGFFVSADTTITGSQLINGPFLRLASPLGEPADFTIQCGQDIPAKQFFSVVVNDVYSEIISRDNNSSVYMPLNLTAKNYKFTSGSAGNITGLKIMETGDVYTIPITDYSATSTIVGWSSFQKKSIWYKKIGKLVYLWFELNGTSNSGTAYFTLPYLAALNPDEVTVPIIARDNGTELNYPVAYFGTSASTLSFYKDSAGTTWTNSGSKLIRGQIFYESA